MNHNVIFKKTSIFIDTNMGVSDYIILYKTEEEKKYINSCIEIYKLNYSRIIERHKILETLRELDDSEDFDESEYDSVDINCVDIDNLEIKSDYIAKCLIEDKYHSNIKTSDGFGIRVFFGQCYTYDFEEHLMRYNLSVIDDPYGLQYTTLEEYTNDYLHLNDCLCFEEY